jgi:hypothetical protein
MMFMLYLNNINSGAATIFKHTYIITYLFEKINIDFCRMTNNNTGAWWVQKKGQISLSYIGASMLRCSITFVFLQLVEKSEMTAKTKLYYTPGGFLLPAVLENRST